MRAAARKVDLHDRSPTIPERRGTFGHLPSYTNCLLHSAAHQVVEVIQPRGRCGRPRVGFHHRAHLLQRVPRQGPARVPTAVAAQVIAQAFAGRRHEHTRLALGHGWRTVIARTCQRATHSKTLPTGSQTRKALTKLPRCSVYRYRRVVDGHARRGRH